jgi:hypothetical protein
VVFIYTVSGLARDGRTNGGGEHLMPGKCPKENIQGSEHGENLKSRISCSVGHVTSIL